MKYLRKIFESGSDDLDLEILKSFIEDLEEECNTKVKDLEISIKCAVFSKGQHNDLVCQTDDGDSGLFLLGCGFIIKFLYYRISKNDNPINVKINVDGYLDNAMKIKDYALDDLETYIIKMSNRIEENFNCNCYIYQPGEESIARYLIIKKNDPSDKDRKRILLNIIGDYVVPFFIDIKMDGNNMIFTTDTEMTKDEQEQHLHKFMEDEFESISYVKFGSISKNKFFITDPSIKSIKF